MKRNLIFGLAVAVCLLAGRGLVADEVTPAVANPATVKLQLEVRALSTLNSLELTAEQLASLKDMAADTAGKPGDPPTPITADDVTALKGLKAALLSHDDDKIDAAQEKVDDLAEKQDADSEPDVEPSDAAKAKAAEFVKLLSPRQVALFIGENGEDVENPGDLLVEALHQSRDASPEDFRSLCEDTAREIGVLAAGVNPAKPPRIAGRVTGLLQRARKMSAAEFSDQQTSLEDEAKKLVAGIDPVMCVRHWMESEIADFLSNPELVDALGEWTPAKSNP
jgi:hypothetical protein